MEFLTEFSDWAWARHHNEWSWFIRPFIVLAFCTAAWFRRRNLVVAIGFFFPISAVVFPAPAVPKPYVIAFLNSERQLLEGLSLFSWFIFVSAVVLFLWLLAAAFWKRSFWLGILLANAATAIKLMFSLFVWPDTGQAAIFPSLLTMVIVNALAFLMWQLYLRRKSNHQ